tara:strand:- start:814 stop:984 length:171 start_codon:yes stop_codon:yes gene_type:complete
VLSVQKIVLFDQFIFLIHDLIRKQNDFNALFPYKGLCISGYFNVLLLLKNNKESTF